MTYKTHTTHNTYTKMVAIIFVAAIAVGSLYWFFPKTQQAEAGWFDDSWLYRQIIAVANSGSAQTDFQVQLTVDTATLITATKMQSDCDDIRITDLNGKLLDHWLEPTTCNTAATKIWTKIPSIPAATGASLYLYYGNTSAASASSTTNTFIREISGVQGAWDMNEAIWVNDCATSTVLDASGNANHGKSCPNAGGTQPTAGKFGNGGVFDGSNDYVNFSSNPINRTAGTVSLWIKGTTDSTTQWLIDEGADADTGFWLAFAEDSSKNIHFNIKGNSVAETPLTYDAALLVGNWHQITIIWEDNGAGSSYMGLAIDGMIVSDRNDATVPDVLQSDMKLGAPNSLDRAFSGSLDDVRIYNRALSAPEISDLYGTGGDRQGYVTTNYPNKSLVRKYSADVSVGSPATEERGPGPVAYWKFDEGFGTGAQDTTINNNDGAISGATWQSEDMCVSGKCLRFDGVDDYVNAGNDASLNITNAITISAWIKAGTTPDGYILNKGDAYRLSFTGTTVYGGVYDGAWHNLNYTNIVLNQWYHVSISFDGINQKIYINGILQNTVGSGAMQTTSNNLFIGSYSATLGRFNGFIDDVKIYPYARTAAQIKTDYASRGSSSGSSVVIASGAKQSLSNGLVGYWKMDEASWSGVAGEVLDASGTGNNGVAAGATHKPTTGAGKFGNGGVFDGVDDYVSIPYNNIGGTLTYSLWTKSSISGGGYRMFSYMSTLIQLTGNNITFFSNIYSGDTTTKTFTVVSDVWYNIIVTHTGTTTEIFVNGVSLGSATDQVINTANSNTNAIGAYLFAGGNYYTGSIDEVRIYNRALSPKEVRDLYNFAPGPVGYWNFNEKTGTSANDISGNNNIGTLGGGTEAYRPAWVSGKIGGGLRFDGVNDYVNAGNGASLNITGKGLTLEAWIKTGNNIAAQPIINKWVTGPGDANYLLWTDHSASSGKIVFVVGNADGGVATEVFSNSVISDNNWHYIVGVYDGSNKIIYIDGIQNAIQATTFNMSTTTSPLYIGKQVWSGQFFNGSIDDVRIYNYARTPSQIVEDYAGGAGRKQPVGYWKFDEGHGIIANNSGTGGSALNGTLTTMSSPATPTSGWTDSGKFGKALNFDGISDYVEVTDTTKFSQNTGSYEFWVKTDNWVPSNSSNIYSTQYDTDEWTDIVLINTGEMALVFQNIDVILRYDVSGLSTAFHHFVITYDFDNDAYKMYIDGKLKISSSTAYSPLRFGSSAFFGKRVDNLYYFNGSIDDVKIYNFALTEDEVREEYNSGVVTKLGSSGTTSAGAADNSANREYCIPGDTSTCNPPVARWNFNEKTGVSANDISGNNNIGTLGGGTEAYRPTWISGKIGGGLRFDGVNDYVDAGSNASLNITNAITLEAWVKPISDMTECNGIVNKMKVVGDVGYTLYGGGGCGGSINSIKFWISGVSSVNSNNLINKNQWSYIVGKYDGSSMSVYINGILDAEQIATGTPIDSGLAVTIGRTYVDFSNRHFNGSIDDVRIYNYARTPSQIAWDYNRGKPVAEWSFDECQGATANDASGNGNTGTITIGATGTQTGLGTCADINTANAWYNGRSGKINSAMSFDGTDDYVEVGSTTIISDNDFSIGVWVKRTAELGAGTYWGVLSQGYAILYDKNSKIGFYYNGADHDSSFDAPLNQWIYIVISKDSSGFNFYKNGVFDSFVSEIGTTADNSANFIIGKYYQGVKYYPGLIDEVKIFNYALTAEQVKTEYNGGAVNFK